MTIYSKKTVQITHIYDRIQNSYHNIGNKYHFVMSLLLLILITSFHFFFNKAT